MPSARVPELGPHPSVTELMLAVGVVHPTFAGVYVAADGGPGVHINATGPIDVQAVAALLDSLYSLNGNASLFAAYAARGVAAHRVTYTYEQLHTWQLTAMRNVVAATPYLYAIAIDERANYVELMFVKGIAPEEIELLLTTLDAPPLRVPLPPRGRGA